MPGVREQASWADLGEAWNAVIRFSAAVALYGGLGWFLDSRLNTGHWLFVGGLVLGMVLGIYLMMKMTEQAEHDRTLAKRAGRASE